MSPSIRISGIPQARREFRELNDFLSSPKPMEGFVADARDVILQKTEAGRDFEHHTFEPYSDAYAKRKGQKRVDLEASGTMLGNIVAKADSASRGHIDVLPGAEPGGNINSRMLAQIHNTGTGKMPRREFMNLNKSQIAALRKKWWDDGILAIVRRYR